MRFIISFTLFIVTILQFSDAQQVCSGLIEVDWDLVNAAGQSALSAPVITSSWDGTALELLVNIKLDYITRSKYTFVDQYDTDRGFTYVIDTTPFLSDGRMLSNPNNCENREAASFVGQSWGTGVWSYLNEEGGLGSTSYMEYGPANIWTLGWDVICSKVEYTKVFAFSELLSCTDESAANTFVFTEDTNWLNLTGSIYVTMVSPLINQNDAVADTSIVDIGQYLTNSIASYPISISFPKRIASVRDPAVVLFDISVFAVQYDEKNSKLLIDVLSFTASFINLINVNVITPVTAYVADVSSISIAEDDSYSSSECLFETTYQCYQKFQIQIDLSSCLSSKDLSTPVILETEPRCRTGYDCSLFVSEFGAAGTTQQLTDSLQYVESCDQEVYIQTFDGDIKYYDDAFFSNEVSETHPFPVSSRMYVDVSVDDIVAYSVFGIDVLHVYICTTTSSLAITSQLSGDGGCLGPATIDEIAQPFKDGAVYDTDLEGVIYTPVNDHSVRFSLLIPSFQRTKFWLHAIVNLKLLSGRRRVRLLLNAGSDGVNRISHYVDEVSISGDIDEEPVRDDDNASFSYQVFIAKFVSFAVVFFSFF